MAAGSRRLDALLITHDHADQCHGIDDIRAFALIQRRRIPCWTDHATRPSLLRRFGYVFEGEGGYPAIADLHTTPPHGEAWTIDGPSGQIPVTTFDQDHGGVRSLGYRFGNVAYSSDVVGHPTHAHVEMTLDWIARLKPKRAILTNMHIDLDYRALARRLPPGVEPAYDGMRILVGPEEGAASG